jgi:hypothetical protein
MDRNVEHSGALKWYPHAWRDRYGDDFMMYLHDRYGDGPLPLAAQLSVIRSGTAERLRSGGITGSPVDPDTRIRGASLLVLCAWVFFVVAGSVFAKYTEHWPLATPPGDHWLPAAAMSAVQWAAAAGALIVIVAGVLTLPALLGLIGSDGWKSLWALVRPMVLSLTVAGVASIGIVELNQHVGPSPSGTTPPALRAAGVVVGLLVVSTLAVCCATAVVIVYRLRLTRRVTRILGGLAVAMAGVLVAIFAGTLTWWIATALHAPWFFRSVVPRSPSSPAPLAMILLGLVMLSGLGLAGVGTARIAATLGRPGRTQSMTECG